MRQVRMMVGLPGSGKSTIVKNLSDTFSGSVIISPDQIREQLCNGDRGDQTKNAEVWKLAWCKVKDAMCADKDIIFDATMVSVKSRKPMVKLCKEFGYELTAFFIRTSMKECIRRQTGRDWPVPDHVIVRMNDALKAPTKDEGIDTVVNWNFNSKPIPVVKLQQ